MAGMNKFFVDDRGSFCDIKGDYDFDIKRVYVCENFKKGTIRGFHYHEKEGKLFYVPRGAVKFVCLKMTPEKAQKLSDTVFMRPEEVEGAEIEILSSNKPTTIYIPPGYANAWMTLTDDTILIGCSDRTLQESIDDDIRINPDHTIFKQYWEVKNR